VNKTIFIVLKIYRQIDGEYFAIEPERAFYTKEEVEQYTSNRPGTWNETRQVPLVGGATNNVIGTVPIEFRGFLGIHEILLNEEKVNDAK